jgi:hypothetical protein
MTTRAPRRTLLALAAAAAAGLAPAAAAGPLDFKETASIGRHEDLPRGYFAYALGDSVYVSYLDRFEMRKVPNTSSELGARCVEISREGNWILYGTPVRGEKGYELEVYLVRPDGSGRTRVPVERAIAVGFLHGGPFGTEIFYGTGSAKKKGHRINFDASGIGAIRVDLSGKTPTFGETRAIDEDGGDDFDFDAQKGTVVAADRVYGEISGRVGVLAISEGGRGRTQGKPHGGMGGGGFKCGFDLSHDGRYATLNASKGGFVTGHNGPNVFEIDVREGQVTARLVSLNWVPKQYRGEPDWHYWDFTNDSDYIMGCNQGASSKLDKAHKKGDRNYSLDDKDRPADAMLGIWLLHWRTGRWTLVSPPGMRSKWVTAWIAPEGKRAGGGMASVPRLAPASGGARPSGRELAARKRSVLARDRVTVEATITDVSRVPEEKDFGPYRNILTNIRYRVDRVRGGRLDCPHVIVVHWCVRDRRHTAAAGYRPGERQVLTCEPFDPDAHADVGMLQQVNDLDDFDSPVYWAVKVAPLGPAARAAGSPSRSGPDREAVVAAIRKALAAGRRPSFYLASMRKRARVVSVAETGELGVAVGPMRLRLPWSRLSEDDRASLASAVLAKDRL